MAKNEGINVAFSLSICTGDNTHLQHSIILQEIIVPKRQGHVKYNLSTKKAVQQASADTKPT